MKHGHGEGVYVKTMNALSEIKGFTQKRNNNNKSKGRHNTNSNSTSAEFVDAPPKVFIILNGARRSIILSAGQGKGVA